MQEGRLDKQASIAVGRHRHASRAGDVLFFGCAGILRYRLKQP
jgi:hypothetical protein